MNNCARWMDAEREAELEGRLNDELDRAFARIGADGILNAHERAQFVRLLAIDRSIDARQHERVHRGWLGAKALDREVEGLRG
jgi:hypothetical protein